MGGKPFHLFKNLSIRNREKMIPTSSVGSFPRKGRFGGEEEGGGIQNFMD
jgi:hypothetical protein